MSLFDGSCTKQLTYFDVTKCIDSSTNEPNGDDESIADSWVDIAPSRGSLSSTDAAVTFDADALQRDFSRDSPVSVHSSIIEFEANLEQVKCRLTKDLPTRMSTDWIWDWSSRPECVPVGSHNHRSVVSTPPNSLQGSSVASFYRCQEKQSFTRLRVLCGLVFSNFFTFVIGAAIGFYVCKRIVRDKRDY
ncbi:unnamed protein product [Enterobius vermicularis]|uniref:BNIP2 motif-containing molecule at the C-terminal region 1 n=1 Tax=Enterobius vermicularis TaxID=51028 RepID=A0A0N4V771_ENTVE|nr:unnamed protein product [Enterobius vermicularis]